MVQYIIPYARYHGLRPYLRSLAHTSVYGVPSLYKYNSRHLGVERQFFEVNKLQLIKVLVTAPVMRGRSIKTN